MFVDWTKIPLPDFEESVRAYVERGRPMGHFLEAVFSNDLMEAARRADDRNQAVLAKWALFLHWELPGGCHGSREKVKAWIARKGMSDNPLNAVLLDIADIGRRR